jgi:hypothetical protein
MGIKHAAGAPSWVKASGIRFRPFESELETLAVEQSLTPEQLWAVLRFYWAQVCQIMELVAELVAKEDRPHSYAKEHYL